MGYVSRPCGFDFDHDGIVGEPEDCRVCDGRTADPDGDGVAEDLIYVDCQDGVDDPSCGAPDRPCGSVTYAWTVRADGADDGAEDIVCFRGTCSPEVLRPAVGGVVAPSASGSAESSEAVADLEFVEGSAEGWAAAGLWTRARRGSEARDFQYPKDPTMLVGWDSDGDGAYPPHDLDDVAVLDGGGDRTAGGGSSLAFHFGGHNSLLEMAHLTVRDYGRYSDVERSGFVLLGDRGSYRADGLYFHDLVLDGINKDQPAQGHRILINLFTAGTRIHHLAFENLRIVDASGFMVRGSGAYRPPVAEEGETDGPWRWGRLSVSAHGCDHSDPACREGGGSAFVGWKLWGWIDGIEILDSEFDANVGAWEPKPAGNGGAVLVNATQCSRGWTIRGNRILDFKTALVAQGGNGAYCARDPERGHVPRRTGDVVFDRNLFVNTYGPWRGGDVVVHLKGGDDVDRTLDNVVVRHNYLASTDGFDACIWVDVGHRGDPEDGQPGRVEIYNNTCWGSRAEGRAVGIQIGGGPPAPVRQQDVRIRGNVISGQDGGDENLRLRHVPEKLVFSGNVFDPGGRYRWLGHRAESLAQLERALGGGLDSVECEPQWLRTAGEGPHLDPRDACARGAGDNLSFWTSVDVDGEPRPESGAWDAGCDQVTDAR
ncbi:MAG: hypothetical protein AAGN66_05950 [Acidobacteriota bacterium]